TASMESMRNTGPACDAFMGGGVCCGTVCDSTYCSHTDPLGFFQRAGEGEVVPMSNRSPLAPLAVASLLALNACGGSQSAQAAPRRVRTTWTSRAWPGTTNPRCADGTALN